MDEFDECGEDHDEIVRAKWLMDGAKTLSEAAAMLRGAADSLEQMEAEGRQLRYPVDDDYGYIYQKIKVLV